MLGIPAYRWVCVHIIIYIKLINCPVVIIICKYYCEVLLFNRLAAERRAAILNNTIFIITYMRIVCI